MGDGSQPSQTAPKTCVEAVAATASQARAECKAQGMRLCRLEELRGQSGACCKSGCSFDAERVWTADKCQPTAEDIQRRELEAAEAAALDARLRRTLASCGPLCNTSRPVLREPGGPARFATTTAPIRCDALYNLDDEASAAEAHRPLLRSELPSQWILDAFTMAGRYPLSPGQGMSQQYLGQTAMVPFWGEAMVEEMVSKARSRRLAGNYGADETNRLLEGLRRAALSGKSVLVIGSENPWVEAACLAEGAAHVTTLEYGKISTDHPKLTTFTPAAFRAARRAARLPRFGAVVTFSSVEHSGLGRYGDALNPWGDLIAIGRAWCVADDDAKLVIGVMSGRDRIEWNAHRRYGALRYPYLATNWRLEWASEKGKQRVHVFQRFVDPAPTLTPLPPEPSRASRCAASAGSEAAAVAPVAAASAVAAAQDGRPPRLHAATAGTAPRAHAKRAGRRLHAEREGDESPQALSVAIATCRRADHLKRVLPIYLRHPRVSDVVVTDDCSTDAEALRAWLASGALEPAAAAKLTVVANARQLWPLANKLSAVERARGPWVAVLDSDNTALASYFDTLFDFWRRTPADPTTIYTPQRLLRPQAGPDGHLGAHLAVGFDFTLLVGRPCDAASWSTCAKSSASAVLNAGNNVVHRETALRAWRPAVQRSSTSAKDVWLDSQLMNRLMVEQGCKLRVVPNLEYVHPASGDSFYKRGVHDAASQHWLRNAELERVNSGARAPDVAASHAAAGDAWSTFIAAGVRCCDGGGRCVSVCAAEQRAIVAEARGQVWEPKLGTNGLSTTAAAAAAECAARGWRLCARSELGQCCKTGCGMDRLMVWTREGGVPALGCERGGDADGPNKASREPPRGRGAGRGRLG